MGEQWGWTWHLGSRKQPSEEESGWGELAGPRSTQDWVGFYARCTGKPLEGSESGENILNDHVIIRGTVFWPEVHLL